MRESETRASRRDFLVRWASGALLATSGSILGALAAHGIYAAYSIHTLGNLNAGQGRALYPGRARAPRSPSPARRPGEEPPLFIAGATAAEPSQSPPAAKPLSIAIPAIGVRSECVELTTQVVDGELVWKTPDHAVGHHAGTALPGEDGNSVFSGHISSPLRHEGNVFHRLPELTSKLGSDIEIVMEGGARVHYQVAATQVVTPTDVWVMEPTETPVLTLLTCVPDGVYTHRLVVSGTLVSGGG